MNRTTVESLLKARFPAGLVDELLKAYREIEENYALGKWKASELDSGHFVESVRRIIESELQAGSYTPIGKDLPKFNDAALRQYEQAAGDESFRILMPRMLYGVYGIRNKRGVGHVGPVSPNRMDSSVILYNAKWVLAELVRLASGLTPDETQRLVDEIVERQLDVLWKHGDVTRILDTGFTAREKVLIHLYDKSPQKDEDIRQAIEYANATEFRGLLKELHKKRLIEYTREGVCIITPKGTIETEKALKTRSPISE